jgi:hypothetical protein
MFKNWKTTLSGALNFVCTTGAFVLPKYAVIFLALSGLFTTTGLMSAKDNNVTGIGTSAQTQTDINQEGKIPTVPEKIK